MVTVRKARVEDLDAINELTDIMHRHMANPYRLELSKEELEEEHFGEGELENTYVAESAGNVFGYISFSKGKNEWAGPYYEIEHIVVAEKHRRQRIGKGLFNIVLEKAKREKVNITAGTLAKNQGALRFYEELGFKPLSIGLLLDIQKRIPE
ncbi:MAG: GNAT family N-acetyltransferase [Promethearchaeota archaeon]